MADSLGTVTDGEGLTLAEGRQVDQVKEREGPSGYDFASVGRQNALKC